MSITYSDILTPDLPEFRPYIKEKDDVRCNLAMTRCVIKWEGALPAELDAKTSVHRNQTEAQVFYNSDPEWDDTPRP